jgi:phospholipid/cholesterol/gamma-HCH transport system substrate-binding protein
MNGLKSGNGTMGKLNDDALYNNLNKLSRVGAITQDVRLHPTKYVNVSLFGKR